jgi:hypothetical protein
MIPASSVADLEAPVSPDEAVCGTGLTVVGLLNLIDFRRGLLGI